MGTSVQEPAMALPRPELWRIRDRGTFEALRVSGRRVRRGPLTVTFLAAPPACADPPRVGFTVGRAAGSAVVRNRIRRRLRAAMRELAAGGRLPSGAYVVGAGAEVAQLPWAQLVQDLAALVTEVQP